MKLNRRHALRFIVLLGIVSLFADMTYEGARSIVGPYLALLGASGTAVGAIMGFGALIGYGVRFLSGYLSDKTEQYWLLTIVGYVINLLAVPLLAFAGSWQIAALLIVLERFGKGIRTPARDAMLSYATKEVGRGWGFGLHESLDQIGALLGPLMLALIIYFKGSYGFGFELLLFPAIAALAVLMITRFSFPTPQHLEPALEEPKTKGFSKTYWLYLLAVGCVAAGYADFALVAFHFQKASIVPAVWIPLFYAIAMGVDGLAALIMGRLFDIKGIPILIASTLLSAFFAPCVFLGGFGLALTGVILWGIGMGSQESIMRAAVAVLVPPRRRGAAYGLFHLGFGLFWFFGSLLLGILYDVSVTSLVIFSVVIQLASLPLFWHLRKQKTT